MARHAAHRTGMLMLALTLLVSWGAPLAQAHADSAGCSMLSGELLRDPLSSGLFKLIGSTNLYRYQARPYTRLPVGVRLDVLAPTGVTEADLVRAALCSRGESATSPLGVPGGRISVRRRGAHFELHITADGRSAALEIQRRAANLR